MNFSCPDSEFWLDDRKVLGFCGVLYSETFKALCVPSMGQLGHTKIFLSKNLIKKDKINCGEIVVVG